MRDDARPAIERVERLAAADAAWLAAAPCAVLVVLAVLAFGPALGRLLFATSSLIPLPSAEPEFLPEPTEQARYLIALSAPVLLSASIVLATRLPPAPRQATAARAARLVQLLGAAFVVVCIVVQRRAGFETLYTANVGTSPHTVYFTLPTLAVAGAIALVAIVGMRSRRLVERVVALAGDSRARVLAATAIATIVVAISILPAINFETTILAAHPDVRYHVAFTFDETYAVLDGRSPLVNFTAQYGSLWPYAFAAVMSLVGESVGVFTTLAAIVTALAMLSVFAVLRRVVRNALVAVTLFLPLLATSLFKMSGSLGNRYSLVNLMGTFPLRYAGPCFLLWLTARHLDRARPRRRWPLFLLAGVIVMNNGDVGIPALGALLAALLWAERPSLARSRLLAAELVLGLGIAFALVALLTLLRAGSLPHLALLFRFSRLFAVAGFGMLPIKPVIGVSTIIYLTYVAAIGTATVRVVRRDPDQLLTGLLAWSGIFGLGVGSYYVGRSHPEVLTNMFPAWAFSITLLLVAAVRSILARASRLPSPAEAACLVGFGVLACSLAQTPTPWSQAKRLERTAPAVFGTPYQQPFVAAHTRRGEHVAILTLLGHRIGANLGIVDVTPYTGDQSMPTFDQVWETLDDLSGAGGSKVFVSSDAYWPELPVVVERAGFRVIARDRASEMLELEDG